jgi:putative ABC transport system permease protein
VIIAALLGVMAAFMTSSLLASLMFGIQPAEPWVYSVTIALLIAIGMLSSVGPTLRAMHTDPVETLRSQ